MSEFFRVAWHVVRKDMTVEVRSKEILLTTLLFAVSVVLVFSFAIVREGRAPDDVAAGILWVAISFAGTLAMGRTFERERYNDTLRALLLAPADRPAIYTGKLLGLVAAAWVSSRSCWCRSSDCCSARRSSAYPRC